jgi:hypothetical protein
LPLTALNGRAAQMRAVQIRMGGARACPAVTANRMAEPRRAGGGARVEKVGVNVSRANTGGRMPRAPCNGAQQGQEGQSPLGQGAWLPPPASGRGIAR